MDYNQTQRFIELVERLVTAIERLAAQADAEQGTQQDDDKEVISG